MTSPLSRRVLVVAIVLVLGAVAVGRANRSETVPARTSFAAFPMTIGEWRGHDQPPLTPEVLAVLGANDYLTRTYATDHAAVGLYIGYWQSQRQGDTIHSPLNCLPGAGWEPVSQSVITLPDASGHASPGIPVKRIIIEKGIDRSLVLYWYQSHGRVV